jgi:hypothetical protein
LLFFLHEDNNFLNSATINKIICAEFTSREANPKLHSIIIVAMVHGPSGDEDPNCRCMTWPVGENVKCSKGSLKAFNMKTTLQATSFMLY